MKRVSAIVVCGFIGLAIFVSPCHATQFSFFTYLTDPSSRPSLVAFSPSHYDPRPGIYHRVPARQSITDDLRALRPAFDGLMLYGYDKDVTPIILEEARRQGYRAVLLGIWDPNSREEITSTVQLINQYQHQLALAVCVGNEGIAFDRYTISNLQTAIATLAQFLSPASRVPVCTSEPLDEYIDGGLRAVGDFLYPNIHFIFGHPQKTPSDAAQWVRRLATSLAEDARKPVFVKETGFPHGGSDRFTLAAQRAFWGAYLQPESLVRYPDDRDVWVSFAAAFEAFDLHWKAEQSGMIIEEMWGLLSSDRKPHPAFFIWEETKTFSAAAAK